MIKIIAVDDHDLIREGFKKIIAREVDMRIVGEAKSAKEAFEILKIKYCDVLVLDISLPDKNGLDVLKELKPWYPDLAVLIFSMHPEERFAIRALQNGASGYITKGSAPDELVSAIRKVHFGGKYMTNSLAQIIAQDFVRDKKLISHEKLSDREFQILLLIGSGESVSNISAKLSLSVNTINTYRRRILEKMNMNTNADLIRYVIQNNLIE